MAYSYVVEGGRGQAGARSSGEPLIWFGAHASVTTVYLPVPVSMYRAPAVLATGTVKSLQRDSAFWAFRHAKHVALVTFDRWLLNV